MYINLPRIAIFFMLLPAGWQLAAQGVIEAANEEEHRQKVEAWRQQKDSLYRIPGKTMLPESLRKVFDELNYYPVDYTYRVKGRLVRYFDGRTINIETNSLQTIEYLVYGRVEFALHGRELALEVYRSKRAAAAGRKKGALFIPFYDETSGNTTYGGGRYLVLDVPEDDTLTLDFNMAYNPYCVYDPEHVCPLPPAANYLPVKVEAGEKMYP